MVSVEDYSVYVTDIKTALRKIEDFCLKAEVGADIAEFYNALGLAEQIGVSALNLEDYMRRQRAKMRKQMKNRENK